MSRQIDEGVVAMKFDNSTFMSGVSKTLGALDKLRQGLAMKNSTNGLDQVEKSANRMSFKNIEAGLSSVTDKFKAMSMVGITALTNITNKVVDAGLQMGKSLAIGPITDGFSEYELKMGSIQTILANTARDGTKLKDVSGALDQLNKYADKTIYNFGDMTRNIGLFTNAGIKLKDATAMIKGFSNEAAASGTSSQGAASAAYQLSQALSSGKITLMDWKSLTNVGMGNKLMQTDIISIADAMGTLKDKGVKAKDIQKDFNKSLEKGWLTAGVMSKYLGIMSKDYGEMTAKQIEGEKASLRKLGLDNKEIDALIAKAKTAQDAATKVRTATQLFGTLKEAIGSGWSDTFEQILGNFDEATNSFTNFSKMLGGVADKSAASRHKLLADWKKDGGRVALIDGLIEGFKALMQWTDTIKSAFHDIFPPATGKQLADLSRSFKQFMINLQMTPATVEKVKTVFKGLFAGLDIGWQIIKRVLGMFKNLFAGMSSGDGTFTNLVLRISEWLIATDKALKKGESLGNFFKKLESILQIPITAFKTLVAVIESVINSFGSASPAVDKVTKSVDNMGQSTGGAVDWIVQKFQQLMGWFKDLGPKIAGYARDAASGFGEAFRNGDFNKIVDGLNTGFLGALTLTLRKFLSGISLDLSGGAFENLNKVFEQLTGNLKAMEQNTKASAILKIAGALALLAVSALLMASVDPAKLGVAMGALTIMFAQLGAALMAFDKATGTMGALKLPLIAAGLVILAGAIALLTISIKVLSTMSWEELAKGMAGLGVALGLLAGFTQTLSSSSPKLAVAAVGFLLLSVAMAGFVFSIKQFAGMDWAAMGKGMAGMGAVLAQLSLFTQFAKLSKIGLSSGVGLVLLAASMKILASAVGDFGAMDMATLGKGLGAMSIGLAAIAGAIYLIPKSAILQAAAIAAVAGSLNMLVPVIMQLGNADMVTLGKGLGSMAAGLGLIAIALKLMPIAGAAALWVAVDAISNLATVLAVLAGMGLQGTIAALAGLTGALTILGLAGLILSPIVPVLQALGYAILSMGIGAAAAGFGLLSAAVGLGMLAASGAGAAIVITALAAAVIGVIPALIQALGVGLVLLAQVFTNAAPTFLRATVVLITTLLTAVSIVAPKIVTTVIGLINMLLNKLVVAVPQFVTKGMMLITGLLNGIASKIGGVVTAAVNLIVALLNGIAKNIGRIIEAGTNLIVQFLAGIAKAVPKVIAAGMKMITDILTGTAKAIRAGSAEMNAAGREVASAIIDGMINGIRDLGGMLIGKARDLASSALSAVKGIFDIHSPSREMYKIGQYVVKGFVLGLDGNKDSINKSFDSLKQQLTDMRMHAQDEVKKQQAALDKLYKARKRDKKKIADTKAALAQAKKEVTLSNNAYNNLTKNWTDDKNRMGQLADQFDVLTDKIKAANDKLVEAKKVRDDYYGSIKNQYNVMPQITTSGEDATTVQNFADGLRKQINDVRDVSATMGKLRAMGLNDTMYKDLLAKGPDALPFMKELLGTGKSGVNQINDLTKQLDGATAGLAYNTSHALYQAGVDSAAGILKGLQSQQGALEKQMDAIANAMVKSIKKSLGIKSPAREMMPVGEFAVKGVSKGLDDFGHLAEESAQNVGVNVIDSMRKSIVGLDDVVNGGVDMTPVIRPVLDLTDIRNKAGAMDSLLAGRSVSATASYGQATGAAADYAANQRVIAVQAAESAPAVNQLTFVQNNSSPKALGAAEIYRQTNNQLSRLRGALNP